MSGFAIAYGTPQLEAVNTALDRMAHRGPMYSGSWSQGCVAMAQNYLAPEHPAAHPGNAELPMAAPDDPGLRICYDGQISTPSSLAQELGLRNINTSDEELVLHLYKEKGAALFEHLNNAIFAFAISDGKNLLAARDILGIRTLFYARENGTLYLSSELKGLAAISDDLHEFPAGHFMDNTGRLQRYADLPYGKLPPLFNKPEAEICQDIRSIIERIIRENIDLSSPTAALLSGGMDSSVISCLASKMYKERYGSSARLPSFAIGVGEESGDIKNARLAASHFDTDHHELIVSLDEILEVLPDVVYHLESFDPSLVRSAVANYLISRHASRQGIQVLLSGEGGDEIFCGYSYLKHVPFENMALEQLKCLGFLHNNASLRLDRMNQCHSIRVVAPLISGELLNYALQIPPELKQKPDGNTRIEKYIFRKAYEPDLPEAITWRLKQEFSQGSGSAGVLPRHFDKVVDDREFLRARTKHPILRSKEEYHYFKIFTKHFGDQKAVDTVGQWISL